MKKLIRIFMLLDIIEELRAKNKRLVDRNRKLLEENRSWTELNHNLLEENKALHQMVQMQEVSSDIPGPDPYTVTKAKVPGSLTVTDVKEGE